MLGSFVAAARGEALRSMPLVGSASMGLRRAPMREMQLPRRHMSAADIAELQRTNLGILMFADPGRIDRSEEHTSELQSHSDLVCRLLLEKKNNNYTTDQVARRTDV